MLGSHTGIALQLLGVLGLSTYIAFLWDQMQHLKRDSYSSVTVTNDYSDEFNDLNIDDLNFMPYYEIRLTKDLDTDRFDIYEDTGGGSEGAGTGWDAFIPIDYAKLSRYV